jgi:hypothetical protein
MHYLQIVNPKTPAIPVRHLQRSVPENAELQVEDVSTSAKIIDRERASQCVKGDSRSGDPKPAS